MRISATQTSLGRPAQSAEPLPLELRLIGNCRDYSSFFVALLREAGIPSRARCGFGTYFMQGRGVDHWVAERWDSCARRWVISDPQLDDIMIEKMKISFDPMDLPDGAFLSAGEAWLACRSGDDPDRFGIFDVHGWDFIKGDVVHDIAALSSLELLPWDSWGIMATPYAELSADDFEALDAAAAASPMRALLTRDEAARVGDGSRFALTRRIMSYSIATYMKGDGVEVDLGPIA